MTERNAAIERWARERPDCRLVVVFGSEVEGSTGPRSDLDLALLLDPLPGPEERLRIIGQLQDLAGTRIADVVFLHRDTNPVLRFEIFRNGTCVYESEPDLFLGERVRAVMLHEDARPFRRALRERLATSGSAKEGS